MPKLGKLISAFAPIAASLIPGGGAIAETAKRLLAGKLKIGDSASETDIEMALAEASPQTLLEIRNSDQELEVELKRLDIEKLRVYASGQDSARKRHATVRDKTTTVLAYLVVGGTVCLCALMGRLGLSDFMAGLVFGLLGSCTKDVIGFFFGSSADSADYAEQTRRLVDGRAGTP